MFSLQFSVIKLALRQSDDKGKTLETSAFQLFTFANLRYQLSWLRKLANWLLKSKRSLEASLVM